MMREWSAAFLVLSAALAGVAVASQDRAPRSHLVVWTGDGDREDSDFLAVIEATRSSEHYGEVVTTAVVGERGTNPHHSEHVHTEGRFLFASGFAGNRLFRFDVGNPLRPRFVGPVAPVDGLSFAHSFERLPDGHVLATMQARGPQFDGDGGLAEFDDDGRVVRSSSAAAPDTGSNEVRPYSLAVVPSKDRIVTTSSRMGVPRWASRGTGFDHEHAGSHIQLWRLSDLALLRTVALTSPEGQDAHMSPFEPRLLEDGETVLIATARCGLYRVVDLDKSFSPELVYRFDGTGCAVPVRVGRFWIQGVRSKHRIVVLDVANPRRPVEVSSVEFDDRQGLHWLSYDAATNRLVAVNDDRDEARIWMLDFDRSTGRLALDAAFRDKGSSLPGVSFDREVWPHGHSGRAVPHGTVFVH